MTPRRAFLRRAAAPLLAQATLATGPARLLAAPQTVEPQATEPGDDGSPAAGPRPQVAQVAAPQTAGGGVTHTVVVVGGGFGGLAAARALARLGRGRVQVVLVDPEPVFTFCPQSALVLSGDLPPAALGHRRDRLADDGIRIVRDRVDAIDASRRLVRLASGDPVHWDRLIVSPGVDFVYDGIDGLHDAAARADVPHAWRGDAQTLLLRRQIETMRNGGLFVITVPEVPFRCPPAPYERACTVASYFQRSRMRSKILVCDANPDVAGMRVPFLRVWKDQYPQLIEYRPQMALTGVDAARRIAHFDFDDVQADVLNVIPPQRAGAIARQAGLVNVDDRWCAVHWRTMESTAVPRVHVIGDATSAASGMPKSGTMAVGHGRLAAAAVHALLHDEPPPQPADLTGVCYSHTDPVKAMHLRTRLRWDAGSAAPVPVHGDDDMSARPDVADGETARAWGDALVRELTG